jgi:methionine sulfoxide reductase heme-binding subunit
MKRKYLPIFLALLLGLGAIWIGIAWETNPQDQAQLAARYTARVAFPLFLLTYLGSSLATLWPNASTQALVRTRRQWGLGFALAHIIHLGALIVFYKISGWDVSGQTLAGGGLAYVMLIVMAATSNNWSVRALGRWWKRLHRFGIHWLWFIFTFTYVGRLLDPASFERGIVQFVLCLAALGLRLVAWRKRR